MQNVRENLYYRLEGKTVIVCKDVMEWAATIEDKTRQIKVTVFKDNDVTISTVFLGIDHNFFGGKPLLFETMIFGGTAEEYCNRYSDYDEAIKGHDEAVKYSIKMNKWYYRFFITPMQNFIDFIQWKIKLLKIKYVSRANKIQNKIP